MEEKDFRESIINEERDRKKALDRINVAMLTNLVKGATVDMLSGYLFELKTPEVMKSCEKQLNSYMSRLTNERAIEKFKVDVKQRTWEDVYPGFFKRNIAKLTYWMVKKGYIEEYSSNDADTSKYKWYHYVLPFTRQVQYDYLDSWELMQKYYKFMYPEENIEDFHDVPYNDAMNCWVDIHPDAEWVADNCRPTIINKVYIDNPLNYMDVDLFITPVRSIERIEVTFNVTKEGDVQ